MPSSIAKLRQTSKGYISVKNPAHADSNTAEENKISKLQAATQNKIPEIKICKL